MTEADWQNSINPTAMLDLLRSTGRASGRKFRLLSCACCRVLPFARDERFYQTLEAVEQYADGQTSKAALKRARQAVRAARFALPAGVPEVHGEWSIYWLAEVAASENAYAAVADEMQRLAAARVLDLPQAQRSLCCSLVRDIFGPSLQQGQAPLDPAWLTDTVKHLAEAAYTERSLPDGTLDAGRLAVLADTLEEVGCTQAPLLEHLRGPGPHVRGCWVVDLLTGKA